MGYTLELNPNEFGRTQQGGCIMTARNTDTGIIEPFSLFDGRASGRTAINRDGLIYDVLPYEPAMTLVDGEMVLSEESLGEQLFFNSGWFGDGSLPTNWSYGQNTGTSTEVISLFGDEITAYRITTSDSRQFFNYQFAKSSGVVYYASICTEDVYVSASLDSLITSFDAGTYKWYENGVEVLGSTMCKSNSFYVFELTSTSTETGNIRIGLGAQGNVSGDIVLSKPTLSTLNNVFYSSFIISPIGETATRLGATGVQTPDISKWVDKDNFSISIESKVFVSNSVAKRISYYIDSNDRVIFDFVDNQIKVFVFAKGVNIDNKVIAANITEFNNITVSFSSGNNIEYRLNSESPDFGGAFNGFTNSLMFLSFTTSGGVGDAFQGDVKNIKITS